MFKILCRHICVHETGGHWVPGGESCRTASGPEGSSAKTNLSGAQDYLVTTGSMNINAYMSVKKLEIGDCRNR